jgi:hypothetical protein
MLRILINYTKNKTIRQKTKIIENAMYFQYKNLEIVPIEIEISISLKTPRFQDLEMESPSVHVYFGVMVLVSV